MIDALFTQPNYLATKKLLDATALRHEAIASNLANVETPNYKRVDLAPDFQAQLRQALASQSPSQLQSLAPALRQDISTLSNRRDGNNVEMEKELMNLNQNSLEHAVETQLITGNLLKLRLAITGRSA